MRREAEEIHVLGVFPEQKLEGMKAQVMLFLQVGVVILSGVVFYERDRLILSRSFSTAWFGSDL